MRFNLKAALLIAAAMLISGCDNEVEVQKLSEGIEVGALNLTAIDISSTQNKLVFEPEESWQLVATGTKSNATTVDVSQSVRWSVSDTTLATVSASGLLTTRDFTGNSTLQVTVSWGPYTESLDVTLSDATLVSLAIASDPAEPDECLPAGLQATGTYSDASERPLTDVSWSVDDSNLAFISGNRLIPRTSGIVTLTGTRRGVSSTPLPITVVDTLTDLQTDPATAASVRTGSSLQLRTLGDFSGGATGQDITEATRWSSSNSAVATVSETGQVTTSTAGDATITAGCGGLEDTLTINALNATDVIIVDPLTDRLKPSEVRQLSLFEVLSDSSRGTEDLAQNDSVIWQMVVGSEVATIDADGILTMKSSFAGFTGTYIQITADYQSFDDEIEIFLELPQQ